MNDKNRASLALGVWYGGNTLQSFLAQCRITTMRSVKLDTVDGACYQVVINFIVYWWQNMSLLHILGRGFQVVLIDWWCLFSGIYLLDILLWQVRFYSLRTNLDHSQVVNIIKLTSPVLKLNIFVNCLLVLTKDCVLRLFLLELSQPTISTLPDQENSSNKGEVE